MKLPSLQSIFRQAVKTVVRFPLMFLCIVIGVTAMVVYVDRRNSVGENFLLKIALFSLLGFPALMGAVILPESKKWSRMIIWICQLVVFALILLYYFITPDWKDFSYIYQITFTLIIIATIFALTIAPCFDKNSLLGFWQFNRKSFSRVFLTALYSITLYGGLSLAMLAVKYLFDVDIESKYYEQLFFIIFGLFGTWFFAAGVPSDYSELNEDQTYTKVLKFFTQNVLIPLVCLYFIILYAYAIRIIVLWQLPKGWVSYLVLALAGSGTIVYLLIWPLFKRNENALVKTYSRYFYILLSPLVILLFVAIGRRIADYGITPNRYFVLVSSIWLLGLILYFIFSKRKNITLIPLSLAFVAIIILFGPWNVFSVSKKSQIDRLEKILTENKILQNKKIVPNVLLSDSVEVEINQILYFLADVNALQTLEKRWDFHICNSGDSSCVVDRYQASVALGLRNSSTYHSSQYESGKTDFNFRELPSDVVDVSGYDYFKNNIQLYNYQDIDSAPDSSSFYIEKNKYTFTSSKNKQELRFLSNGSIIFRMNVYAYYKSLVEKGFKYNDSDDGKKNNGDMVLEWSSEIADFKCIFTNYSGKCINDSTAELDNMTFSLLIKNKLKSSNHP